MISSFTLTDSLFDAGRAKEFVSLTLVLKATIHGSRGDPPHHAD
jgi:hypothetical protein